VKVELLSVANVIKIKNEYFTAIASGTFQVCLILHQVFQQGAAVLTTHSQHYLSADFEYKQFESSHVII